MRNSVLPVMTVLTVIAGAVGMQMGESAISQIDPLYFQGAVQPLRDVSKDGRPQRAPGFADASGWEEGYAARDEVCPGCAAGGMPAAAAASATPVFAYSDPAVETSGAPATAADDVRIERSLEASRVERYLHFPITADQAEIRAGLDGDTQVVEVEEAPAGL